MISYTNCTANDNGEDGFRFGPGVEATLNGCSASGNGGSGFDQIASPEALGFPKGTDAKELASVLEELVRHELAARQAVAQQSTLAQKWGSMSLNGSTLIANLIAISSHPAVAGVIKGLSN